MDVTEEKPISRVSFLLYKDFFNSVEHFTDEQLGKLFRVIHEYQRHESWTTEQEKGIPQDIKVAFYFYKNQFQLDDKKWENRVLRNRENAKLGGRPKKPIESEKTQWDNSLPKKAETETETETELETETGGNDQLNIKRIRQNEIVEKVIIDLNEKLGSKFSCKSEGNRAKVVARLNEGRSLDDFLYVNKIKIAEWKDDPKMARYLRPETLYGSKFEGYLNETVVSPVAKNVKPKYQTADERRRENNKKVFNQTLKEIENVHDTRGNESSNLGREAEEYNGVIGELRRELP